jgi:ABC-type transport system involved in multi-copper enzyme maturation permease subunit
MTVITHPTFERRTHDLRVTQVRVARAEWTKLRTLRSTRYSLLAGLFMTAALPVIVTASRWHSMSVGARAAFDPLKTSLDGVWLAQLAVGVLGVLVISGEYSTGMIRSTLAAVPKRLPVLWAKAAVFALVTFALALPATLIAFFSVQAFLGHERIDGHQIAVSFAAPGVARAVIGGAVYLTVVGLFGLALGAILRNTAAGISALAAVLFVVPSLLGMLPSSLSTAVSPYLPSNAGQAIMSINPAAHSLSPGGGLLLFSGYTLAGLLLAAALLHRRDA